MARPINNRGGRGGMPRALRQRLHRLLASGMHPAEAAKKVGVDRKTAWHHHGLVQKEIEATGKPPASKRCSCGAVLAEGERSPCRACRARAYVDQAYNLGVNPIEAVEETPDGYCEICEQETPHAWEGACAKCRQELSERLPGAD